jgi:Carboxymuconolactone decarboxylase family
MKKKTESSGKARAPKLRVPRGMKYPPAKIKVIEDAEATGAVAEAYDFWRGTSGRSKVPGIIKCFGARPDFLRQVVEFSNGVHFSEGHLNRRQKEMIASYVSFLNRCPY